MFLISKVDAIDVNKSQDGVEILLPFILGLLVVLGIIFMMSYISNRSLRHFGNKRNPTIEITIQQENSTSLRIDTRLRSPVKYSNV